MIFVKSDNGGAFLAFVLVTNLFSLKRFELTKLAYDPSPKVNSIVECLNSCEKSLKRNRKLCLAQINAYL